MKWIALLLLSLAGCSTIQKPYIKESILSKDGTLTVKEISADWVKGAPWQSLQISK